MAIDIDKYFRIIPNFSKAKNNIKRSQFNTNDDPIGYRESTKVARICIPKNCRYVKVPKVYRSKRINPSFALFRSISSSLILSHFLVNYALLQYSGTINSLTLTQIASTLSCFDRDHRVEATCNSKKRAPLTNRNDCVAQVPREIRGPNNRVRSVHRLWIELELRERMIVSDFARFRRSVLRLLCQIRFVQIYTKRSRMCSSVRGTVSLGADKTRERFLEQENNVCLHYIFFSFSFRFFPFHFLRFLCFSLLIYLLFFVFFFILFYVFRDNSECMVPI